MKKLILATITTAAFLPLCTTAQADAHSSETTAAGMYFGATFGKGKHNIKFDNANSAAAHDDSVSTMSAFLGMDLNATFAIEGFYANHGKSTFTGSADFIKGATMGIAAKAGTDLTDDFRAFFKVGYHSWRADSDEKSDGTDVLYGYGLEYKLSETTAIVTAYDRFTYDDSNITDMSIGIKYRF
jgi:hypothetical protein